MVLCLQHPVNWQQYRGPLLLTPVDTDTPFFLALPTCSGHNSYLQGNQLTSTAGTQTIEVGLRHGCRVVELDVYDGPTEPVRGQGWQEQPGLCGQN
jgi:hypothetical protein